MPATLQRLVAKQPERISKIYLRAMTIPDAIDIAEVLMRYGIPFESCGTFIGIKSNHHTYAQAAIDTVLAPSRYVMEQRSPKQYMRSKGKRVQ